MIRELIDSELEVVAGGHGYKPHPSYAPKINVGGDFTVALGNVSAGNISGSNNTLTGGSNNTVNF